MADQQITAVTAKQVNFVAALLCSPTVRDAAKLTGISERVAYRWVRESPAVQEEILRQRRETIQQAGSALVGHLGTATETLAEIAGNPLRATPARVSAARAIWDIALKLREQDDLAGRLEELEGVLVAVKLKGNQ